MDAELKARFDAIDKRFEAMEQRWTERFDDLAALIARSFETMEKRWSERFNGLERRVDGIEERLDRIDHRVEAMDENFTEQFISVDNHIRTLHLHIEQFEQRNTQTTGEIRDHLGSLARSVSQINERTGKLEDGVVQLNSRFDGLGDDMRQRFRIVNERLAGSAA